MDRERLDRLAQDFDDTAAARRVERDKERKGEVPIFGLEALRAATHGLVPESTLIQMHLLAQEFGLNDRETKAYASFATRAHLSSGYRLFSAFETLIQGTRPQRRLLPAQRKRPKIKRRWSFLDLQRESWRKR